MAEQMLSISVKFRSQSSSAQKCQAVWLIESDDIHFDKETSLSILYDSLDDVGYHLLYKSVKKSSLIRIRVSLRRVMSIYETPLSVKYKTKLSL